MNALLCYFAVASALPIQPQPLPVAPFNINVGQQVVDLRETIIARSAGVRMVLFVHGDSPAHFQARYPTGSVTAHLRDTQGKEIALVHTGYIYYHGRAGLELTEQAPAARGEAFAHFELDAKVALNHVRVVWLDTLGKRVEDVEPVL